MHFAQSRGIYLVKYKALLWEHVWARVAAPVGLAPYCWEGDDGGVELSLVVFPLTLGFCLFFIFKVFPPVT